MQTALTPEIKQTAIGREADAILRSCVHCGFCNATCPTFNLLADELDGPRGRIYLMKQVLEGAPAGRATQLHLDRCLTCLACESTCPSGVRYGQLLDIGRVLVDAQVPRPWSERIARRLLRYVLPYAWRFNFLLYFGRLARPLLPAKLRANIPLREPVRSQPDATRARSVLLLEGCVQPGLAPHINTATARVLDRFGIQTISIASAGCCGAMSHHLSVPAEALDFARRNIDAWWPAIEGGAEAIVITASGCGLFVKDYGHLLRLDERYAAKAARVSMLTKDIGEFIALEPLSTLKVKPRKVAFHSPCTLQHGQKLNGVIEGILQRCGFILTPVPDAHLCCGSAGTYSLLQNEISQALLKNKVTALESGAPEMIATANIGCWSHLRTRSGVPVKHWIELLDNADYIKY